MRIALQTLLNRKSHALHPAAHVGVIGRDPDPDALGIGISSSQKLKNPLQRRNDLAGTLLMLAGRFTEPPWHEVVDFA